MQSSSADTNFTFGDHVVAVAKSGNQSSSATGDRQGIIHLPDGAKVQHLTDQRDVPQGEVLRRVDIERQGDLLHDQVPQGQLRTDLRGPGKEELKDLNKSPFNKPLMKRYWNFRENAKLSY